MSTTKKRPTATVKVCGQPREHACDRQARLKRKNFHSGTEKGIEQHNGVRDPDPIARSLRLAKRLLEFWYRWRLSLRHQPGNYALNGAVPAAPPAVAEAIAAVVAEA